jgi:hypothetical protein
MAENWELTELPTFEGSSASIQQPLIQLTLPRLLLRISCIAILRWAISVLIHLLNSIISSYSLIILGHGRMFFSGLHQADYLDRHGRVLLYLLSLEGAPLFRF